MDQKSIKNYSAFLRTTGYAEHTIHLYSEALETVPDTSDIENPTLLYEHIKSLLKKRELKLKVSALCNIRAALRQFFFYKTGIIYKEYARKKEIDPAYAEILNDFIVYSTKFKGITAESAKYESQHIKAFLLYMGKVTYQSLSQLEAHDIRDYVCSSFKDLKTSSIGLYVTSLRNFFRFLEYKGYSINESLFKLPLAPADWAKGKVPVILTKDEEERLRNHHPVNTKNDLRNRLIILLMLDLGLRCTEVANLRVTDISWRKGTIRLHNTKNEHDRDLPLPSTLANMIEEYILSERPKTDVEMLFTRKYLQNYLPMNIGCIRRVVREAFQKENITGWWKGSHTLRRTAASHIYNSGVGLKVTADLLGHVSIDSTTSYVKVDYKSLKSIALPWPGENYDE